MKYFTKTIIILFVPIIFITSCTKKNVKNIEQNEVEISSLKIKFKNDFYIGAAINDAQINGIDTLAIKVLNQEMNTITPENIMKWMYIQPQIDSFDFSMSDKYVSLGEKYNMFIVGHTLLWHSQLAPFMNEVKDSTIMANHIKDHINTIVGKYKGRINSWDVVNEALNEDGTLRESIFLKVMGKNYINMAFKLASEANPEAQLVYNDYNLWKPEKRAGVVRLVKELQANGTKIDGVGMQAHWSLLGPSIEDIENSIIAYSELGVKVMFTELDVTALPNPWDLNGAAVEQDYNKLEGDSIMNPYPNPETLPDSVQVKIAQRYEDIFKLFLKHKDKIDRVTFWGINDGQSWLNDWPIKGRTNYPLLFDRNFQPKMAYDSIMKLN
jgi:endo-1,4-beta-xylanase